MQRVSDDGVLNLLIRDDGQGFDLASMTMEERLDHYGLNSMRERAQAIEALFKLDSQIGKGTRILVQLNLNGS